MDMKYLFYNCLFYFLPLLFFLSSCSMFSVSEEVEFKLPEPARWKIYASSGEEFSVDGDRFVLNVIKNEPLGLVARSFSLEKSAGAIYPVNVELEEKFSFPAQVLYSLVLSSINPENEKMYRLSTFNWKRFEEDCAEMGDDIWKVNKEIIMKKIAAGTFRKSDLKIEKTK